MKRILAVLMLAWVGCVTVPETGVAATGERLWLQGEAIPVHQLEAIRVGDVVARDRQGRDVLLSAYDVRERISYEHAWHYRQGSTPIQEVDFFRIAGDGKSEQEVRAYYRTSAWINGLGLAALVAGSAVMTTGLMQGSADSNLERSPLVLGGSLTATVGLVLAVWGALRAGPGTHVLPGHVAELAAEAYNQRLSH